MENYNVNILNDLLGFETKEEKFEFQKEILSLKFVKVIENYLSQNNLSKKNFASSMGYSQSYISQVFLANKFVNIDFLVKAQNAFDMPFEVKLGDYKTSPMDVVYNARQNALKNKKNYSFYNNISFPILADSEELLEG